MSQQGGAMPYRLRAALRSAAAALLLIATAQDAFAALPPGVVAEVVDLQGSGERKPAQEASWVPVHARDDLAGGAFVRTGPASKMALVFADETQIRLNQNSLLQVKSVAGSAGATAGTTTLAVLEGSVEFFNARGSVTVGANEAAVAVVGQAPVRIVLSNPHDRVQWVNAFKFDPRHFAPWASQSLALTAALAAVERNDVAAAKSLLDSERERRTRDIAVYSALGEMELVSG